MLARLVIQRRALLSRVCHPRQLSTTVPPVPPPDAYARLFEPLRIGPVVAPNRFWQVPHCNGMGHLRPRALAAMRGMKAEGGWGVVCTEEVEVHPTSDFSPDVEGRLWDDGEEDDAWTANTRPHEVVVVVEAAAPV